MNREDLEHIIRAAADVTNEYEFVVVGHADRKSCTGTTARTHQALDEGLAGPRHVVPDGDA